MEDVEIYEIIEEIKQNTKILQTMYQDCIDLSKESFRKAEREFVGRLVKEINKELQNYILTEEIDYKEDIIGYPCKVKDICKYDEWPEFKEYVRYISNPYVNNCKNLRIFLINSLKKYGFPINYIFDIYDNGWLKYTIASFSSRGGSSYEDYK